MIRGRPLVASWRRTFETNNSTRHFHGMDRMSSMSMTPAEQHRRAVRLYRSVLGISIALNVMVAFFIIVQPNVFTAILGQPEAYPTAWPKHWGFQLLAINGLYLPGLWDPARFRWPNWMGVGIRIVFSIFFFTQGDGFIPMGIYDGLSGILLLVTYLPVVRSIPRGDG